MIALFSVKHPFFKNVYHPINECDHFIEIQKNNDNENNYYKNESADEIMITKTKTKTTITLMIIIIYNISSL